MGVSIGYTCIGTIDRALASSLIAEADQLPHPWWCEPICLWFEGGELAGDTKLFRLIDDPDDDDFMGFYDARFIARLLRTWSQTHALTWELELAGEQIGQIADGQWDSEIVEFIEEVTAYWPESDEAVEAKWRQIRAAYPED